MAENTKIEWAVHTFNPWMGCTKVSAACDHCYAAAMMDERLGRVKWGSWQLRVRTSPENWRGPLKWDKAAQREDRGDVTVFCASLADVWDNEVDPAWRADLFKLIRTTPNLTWLLLTKRIGNAVDMARAAGGLPPNAALGATMESQDVWDRDAVKLHKAGTLLGAKFVFASVEPMLGPVVVPVGCMPDWVIVGGESGKHARPMNPDWARDLRDQCEQADVPFLVKQWGEFSPMGHRVGKHKAGRTLDGIIHDGMPACISGGA